MRKVVYKFNSYMETTSYKTAEKFDRVFHMKYKTILEEVPEPLYKVGTGKFRAAN